MARYKDSDWDLGNPLRSTDEAIIAVLMDIRDDLKVVSRRLRALECPNFLAIPATLNVIETNTRKPPKKRKKRKVSQITTLA